MRSDRGGVFWCWGVGPHTHYSRTPASSFTLCKISEILRNIRPAPSLGGLNYTALFQKCCEPLSSRSIEAGEDIFENLIEIESIEGGDHSGSAHRSDMDGSIGDKNFDETLIPIWICQNDPRSTVPFELII